MTPAAGGEPGAADGFGGTHMLHIFNGDSSLWIFRETGLEGDACVFADVLHGGPLLPDPTDAAFTEARVRHVVETGFAAPDEAAALHAAWLGGLAGAADHDEVVLWFEHDLFDQLLLLHHIEWFARAGLLDGRVSLICIGSFEGVPDFRGLGQLAPAQFATLLPDRRRLEPGQVEVGRRAWAAVTGDDPRAVERVVAGDTAALPYLRAALVRLLREYPESASGLSRTEALGLRAIAEGATTAHRAFGAYQALEDAPFLGDSSFFVMLAALAGAREPLVTLALDGDLRSSGRPPDGPVALTATGRAVLSGAADHAALSGVRRWVGGVQLSGTVPRWRWDAEACRITGPFDG